MGNRIVLVSDDENFFDYIKTKLELRRSDELFTFGFDKAFENLHHFQSALFIVNSENSEDKTLEFLKILKGLPAIVVAYNDDDVYRRKCYRVGMFDYMSLLTPDSEFRARLIPALTVASLLEKNKRYRNLLAENNIIAPNNDVYLDYEKILDKELQEIQSNKKKAVFIAISPNDQVKFLLQPNLMETIILNNIRKNDVLMNFAVNKYFLMLSDIDLKSAEALWTKISKNFQQKLYVGIVSVTNQSRQKLVSDALNKLHQSINNDRYNIADVSINNLSTSSAEYSNFKQFRQSFLKNFEQTVVPVFYQMQQKCSNKLSGANIEQTVGEGYAKFLINFKTGTAGFNITASGFSKVNVDISLEKLGVVEENKRITFEPAEFEQGLLTDLLEQFITEYMKGCQDENS